MHPTFLLPDAKGAEYFGYPFLPLRASTRRICTQLILRVRRMEDFPVLAKTLVPAPCILSNRARLTRAGEERWCCRAPPQPPRVVGGVLHHICVALPPA